MKHYSGSFNKRSRLLQAPALSDSSAGRLKPLQPDSLAEHLEQVLQVQNDFFPCFDWAFPPPLLNRCEPPETATELFAQPSVEPGYYSLYLHIPFCRKRCKFCYFKVYTDKNAGEVERYLDAVGREVDTMAKRPAIAGRNTCPTSIEITSNRSSVSATKATPSPMVRVNRGSPASRQAAVWGRCFRQASTTMPSISTMAEPMAEPKTTK